MFKMFHECYILFCSHEMKNKLVPIFFLMKLHLSKRMSLPTTVQNVCLNYVCRDSHAEEITLCKNFSDVVN